MSDEATQVADGSTSASPPGAESGQSQPSQAESQTDGSQRAPEAGQSDNYDATYDKLFGTDTRTTAESASPATPSTDSQTTPPTDASAKSDERPAVYAKLDENSYRAMQRTGRLVPPHAWQAMEPIDRANWVKDSMTIVRNNERAFQQQQFEAQQRAQSQNPNPNPVQGAQDVGAQQQVAGQPPTAAGIEAHAKRLADLFGEEDHKAFQAVLQHQLSQQQQQFQTNFQKLEADNSGMARRLMQIDQERAQEAIRKKLGVDEIDFTPFANNDEIQSIALNHLQGHRQAGNQTYSYEDAVRDVIMSRLPIPNIQQQAQQKLLKQRQTSLRGTPERGSKAANGASNRPVSTSDHYDRVYDELASKMATAGAA